uniref:Uncharacterized protein n=1 Tax=Chromera velia CCMP2878 TaxID=1169474 RepID=A0A0G4I081_9ALVE|eukprot:Cvel_34303.t1-p1 / transcript=Cvel_34303.t1 / gene=Cvel_34303 / organism=Chromera_velia_CCMP2878 / gene_product=hypothetical protein / transcript_product=hypothetical protein / location=Cvel_scaffold5835:1293-2588(+) / protein_length=269 / sequence_SO=supercontig / SO=protein_coding / is_pseudo=false
MKFLTVAALATVASGALDKFGDFGSLGDLGKLDFGGLGLGDKGLDKKPWYLGGDLPKEGPFRADLPFCSTTTELGNTTILEIGGWSLNLNCFNDTVGGQYLATVFSTFDFDEDVTVLVDMNGDEEIPPAGPFEGQEFCDASSQLGDIEELVVPGSPTGEDITVMPYSCPLEFQTQSYDVGDTLNVNTDDVEEFLFKFSNGISVSNGQDGIAFFASASEEGAGQFAPALCGAWGSISVLVPAGVPFELVGYDDAMKKGKGMKPMYAKRSK